ncbi:MAG: type II toxin-antitoxin system HicB family antitoxin [Thermoplasmataceae archaeon]
MKYTVILEKDEAGFYVVNVPALPGCFTQGKTREEALENAKEAIESYIGSLKKHNESIPEDVGEEIILNA